VTHALRRPALPWLGAAALASVALGVGITLNLQVTFLIVIAFLGVATLAAPAGAWVLCALVAALTFRGLVEVHALPAVATYVDLPLAWGALAVGLLKRRPIAPRLSKHLRWLGALGLAVALAWAFHPSEVLRPVLYLTLLGEPFAIVGALLADPPSPRLRRALEGTLLALLIIQIPLAALQLATLGPGDNIQGTLYGAGAGHHVISGVVVIGAIWILSGGFGREFLRGARIPVVAALLVIPFLADAKQVILAMPIIVLATSWRGGFPQFLVRAALVVGAVVALLTLDPAGGTAERFIQENQQGQGGKQATAALLWNKLDSDPSSLAFGMGPAETVSRAAFMTTSLYQGADSPLAVLQLKPATVPFEATGIATAVAGGETEASLTSFNSATSSGLGVLGDLGIVGFLAYMGLLLSLFLRLRRDPSAEGIAAACGFALFFVLGFVFDWWEQPPFGVFIGTLAALALTANGRDPATESPSDRRRNQSRPWS
jgi:hypothetical protein